MSKYVLLFFCCFALLNCGSSGKDPEVDSWLIINANLVDKNNISLKLLHLDSPSSNVKANARRSCKDGVNIILPEYMLKKYEGDPFRIDFDLKESKYRVFEKSGERVISEGNLLLEI